MLPPSKLTVYDCGPSECRAGTTYPIVLAETMGSSGSVSFAGTVGEDYLLTELYPYPSIAVSAWEPVLGGWPGIAGLAAGVAFLLYGAWPRPRPASRFKDL